MVDATIDRKTKYVFLGEGDGSGKRWGFSGGLSVVFGFRAMIAGTRSRGIVRGSEDGLGAVGRLAATRVTIKRISGSLTGKDYSSRDLPKKKSKALNRQREREIAEVENKAIELCQEAYDRAPLSGNSFEASALLQSELEPSSQNCELLTNTCITKRRTSSM